MSYSVGGTASAGSDYPPLSGAVNIPVGSSTAAIPISWINDTLSESNETIVLTVSPNAAYQVGSPNSATLKIIDNDAIVTIQATTASASEGGTTSGQFTVTRSRVTDTALSVKFAVAGTAGNGGDYAAIASPVSIPANAATAVIHVNVFNDTLAEPLETVIITLENAVEYLVGSPSTATVNIADNDTPAISSLNPTAVTAGGPAFTLTVLGGDFGDGAIVLWDGTPLTTLFVNTTELRATVPANLIVAPGTAAISVRSGGITSNIRNFTFQVCP